MNFIPREFVKCDGGSCDEVHANHVRVKKIERIRLGLEGFIEMCLDELTFTPVP